VQEGVEHQGELRPAGFHVMAKPAGPICNLDCQYCFYLEKEKLYPDTTDWTMPRDTLRAFIRQQIEGQQTPTISFTWQGGEPLLAGLDFFREVVAIQNEYSGGKLIENSIQTNGVLLNDSWCEFLASERFLVGISVDGPQPLHDGFRVYKGGRQSFDDVIRGVEFLQRHEVEFNTLTVVNSLNGNAPLDVYRFLKSIGSRYLQFIPVVERQLLLPDEHGLTLASPDSVAEAKVTDWSVEPSQFGDFLVEIFDEWVRHDVAKYFVQIFDVALENWLGMTPALCVFRETCGGALAIEHNGDVYSCDHYVTPEHRLGNILMTELPVLASSDQQTHFGDSKRDRLPTFCRECDVRFACHGECPKHRFAFTPTGEPGLNYLCAGYKKFFRHIDPCMSFMANQVRAGRAPADVMQWVRQQDRQSP
jgi:uncharacterized protein